MAAKGEKGAVDTYFAKPKETISMVFCPMCGQLKEDGGSCGCDEVKSSTTAPQPTSSAPVAQTAPPPYQPRQTQQPAPPPQRNLAPPQANMQRRPSGVRCPFCHTNVSGFEPFCHACGQRLPVIGGPTTQAQPVPQVTHNFQAPQRQFSPQPIPQVAHNFQAPQRQFSPQPIPQVAHSFQAPQRQFSPFPGGEVKSFTPAAISMPFTSFVTTTAQKLKLDKSFFKDSSSSGERLVDPISSRVWFSATKKHGVSCVYVGKSVNSSVKPVAIISKASSGQVTVVQPSNSLPEANWPIVATLQQTSQGIQATFSDSSTAEVEGDIKQWTYVIRHGNNELCQVKLVDKFFGDEIHFVANPNTDSCLITALIFAIDYFRA